MRLLTRGTFIEDSLRNLLGNTTALDLLDENYHALGGINCPPDLLTLEPKLDGMLLRFPAFKSVGCWQDGTVSYIGVKPDEGPYLLITSTQKARIYEGSLIRLRGWTLHMKV